MANFTEYISSHFASEKKLLACFLNYSHCTSTPKFFIIHEKTMSTTNYSYRDIIKKYSLHKTFFKKDNYVLKSAIITMKKNPKKG